MAHPGYQHAPTTKERIRAGVLRSHEVRRAQARIAPAELRELERTGAVAPALRPFVAQAQDEAVAIVMALGGPGNVSEQRGLLIRDTARLGVLLAGLMAHACQRETLDLDEVGKITTLATARGRLLSAIGLNRAERGAMTLDVYLAQRTAAGGANGDAPEPEALEPDSSASDANVASLEASDGEVTR